MARQGEAEPLLPTAAPRVVPRLRLKPAVLAVSMLALAACGATDPSANPPTSLPSATASPITVPATLLNAHQIIFLSDTNYPPQESIDPAANEAVGFDVDIARALSARIGPPPGLKASILTQDFDSIIPSLINRRGDAIISAMTITASRSKDVTFIPYFQAGQSILVPHGNPGNITAVTNLCGKRVAVEKATTELQTLQAANKANCQALPIVIQTFATDAEAVNQLKAGAVDAAMDDSPVAAYYVTQSGNALELGGNPVDTKAEGIAVDPKNTDLHQALTLAMLDIMKDGTYHRLLAKWNLLPGGIPAAWVTLPPNPSAD
jgi:polar amino acid transport system substrate-binding protein